MASRSSSLTVKDNRTGRSYEVPVSDNAVEATAFKGITNAIESSESRSEGLLIIDEGFRNTAPVKTSVSHLDPQKGTLQYREYPISALFGNYTYEECTYLLVWGSLPSVKERESLSQKLNSAFDIPSEVLAVIKAFPQNAPIMTIIMAGLSAWASSDPMLIPVIAGRDIYSDPATVDKHISRTLGALGTVVAITYCHQHSLPVRPSSPNRSFIANLLYMMGFKADGEQTSSLEALLLLHAEHGMCNATAAFLHCASTRADPISCLIASLVAIYGPLHGGSNIITYKQLVSIGTPSNIPSLMADVFSGKQRLFGFGHRIYRAVDPRATILKEWINQKAATASDTVTQNKNLLDVASELERISRTEPFFTKRHIMMNTDLYTVLAYATIGLPEDLVFPMICISRAQGFMAHWKEFIAGKSSSPTWRPQQVYVGKPAKEDLQFCDEDGEETKSKL